MGSSSKGFLVFWAGAAVWLLLAGGLAYCLYGSYAAKSEAERKLAEQADQFRAYHNAAVFPDAFALASVKSNETALAVWRDMATAIAARGDRASVSESATVFKQRLQAEVRKMAERRGGMPSGRICAPEFLFGFDKFLGEGGTLPDVDDVSFLSSQLASISEIVGIFVDAGVLEVREVLRPDPPRKVKDEGPVHYRYAAKSKIPKKKKVAEPVMPSPKTLGFTVLARPAAIVSALNGLAASESFIAITSFAFRETADTIVDRLNAEALAKANAEREAKQSSRGRGRGRGRGRAAEPEEEEKKPANSASDSIVVDPEFDAPIEVTLKVAVYDFGTVKAGVEEIGAERAEKPAKESTEAASAAAADAPDAKKGGK